MVGAVFIVTGSSAVQVNTIARAPIGDQLQIDVLTSTIALVGKFSREEIAVKS